MCDPVVPAESMGRGPQGLVQSVGAHSNFIRRRFQFSARVLGMSVSVGGYSAGINLPLYCLLVSQWNNLYPNACFASACAKKKNRYIPVLGSTRDAPSRLPKRVIISFSHSLLTQ